jgi:hypothetical protein
MLQESRKDFLALLLYSITIPIMFPSSNLDINFTFMLMPPCEDSDPFGRQPGVVEIVQPVAQYCALTFIGTFSRDPDNKIQLPSR